MRISFLYLFFFAIAIFFAPAISAQEKVTFSPVDSAWASNSVNVTVFRKNSLVTWKDIQFIAFYDRHKHVVLGKRKAGGPWQLKQTPYTGNTNDAHNIISIMADGDGYLHVAWDHHNTRLRYSRGVAPESLELGEEMPMTGTDARRVTYPEFYRLRNGNLIFLYRGGESGSGNLIINHYDVKGRQWSNLQKNLIDGQGQRNAYWQACVDRKGVFHLSWVWRETPDVASNHDLCYARSRDGGKTWENSKGQPYTLPITAATAEYACTIPQQRELINQTSISTDKRGAPFIATYWRDSASLVPQYRIVYKSKKAWKTLSGAFRTTPFSLSGMGTKQIPVSRPQVMVQGKGKRALALLIFRDAERANRISVASIRVKQGKWTIADLTETQVGAWEPSYDTELWHGKGELNLFVQRAEQVDGEGRGSLRPQIVYVLGWKP